jgi:PAS domain S-box-containing protein
MQRHRLMPYLVGCLTVLLLSMGGLGYRGVDRVAALTDELYDEPIMVWTAILGINENVVSMHRSMKDVVLSTSDADIAKHMIRVDEAEVKAIAKFALIRGRFKGDPALLQDAFQSFLDWRPIRDKVITLSREGRIREAADITQTVGSQQVEMIERKINLLQVLAQQRAQQFLAEAQEARSNTLWAIVLSLGISLVLTGLISRRAIRIESDLQLLNSDLEQKVQRRTAEIGVANENLSAQNEEILAMNEELTAQNEEIEALNNGLLTMNAELEHRVLIRTTDMTAANEELTAQFAELTEIQNVLKQERLLTDALFDSAPGILYLYDDKGNLIRWNKHHEVLTGYSAEELSQMTLLDWYKDDEATQSMITAAVNKAYHEGFASVEAELQRKDGSKIALYLTAVPIEKDGKQYFAGIGIDVSERRRMAQSLAEQEARLRTLVNTIPDLVWVKNVDGVYLSCNHMFERFFGKAEAEIIGKTDYDFVDCEQAGFFRENDRKAMASDRPHVNEEWLVFAEAGQQILVETVKTPLRDSDGTIAGVLGIARNITERKKMEEALEESEARYRAVMEQSPEAVITCAPDTGEIVNANARFTERFGYDLRGGSPLRIFDIIADTTENVQVYLDKVKVDRFLPVQRRVVRHYNGFLIQVERSATLVQYRGRSLLVFTIRDVSDEVRREQEIGRDAQLAARVQHTLLTAPHSSEYVNLDTIYKPYSYVGGDLYFIDWRYSGLVLRGFIADATGHGLGTALHTSSMHVLLREVNELDLPLSEQMKWLNQRAGQYFDEGTFAGVLAFELDIQTRQLRWVCAGIPEIWVATQQHQGVIAKPGMYIGVSSEETFDVHTLEIDVGDSCYFLTDGLSELLVRRPDAPVAEYPAMVKFLRLLSDDEARRDDATAICIHVCALPDYMVPQSGWPRTLRFNGYGDYQRMKCVIASILSELTGLPHSMQEIAVNEAIVNALECRDGIPRQHRARVKFNQIGDRIIVRVKSSRMGFAGNALLRRLQANPQEMFSFGEDAGMGRGIPIMLSTTQRMEYNNEGTEVLLCWTSPVVL